MFLPLDSTGQKREKVNQQYWGIKLLIKKAYEELSPTTSAFRATNSRPRLLMAPDAGSYGILNATRSISAITNQAIQT